MTTKFVKIISTPPGQAPEWVRQKWVGLDLPTSLPIANGIEMGVLGGKVENRGGYHVNTEVAIEILEKKSPEAALWWTNNVPVHLMAQLVFKAECCQLI